MKSMYFSIDHSHEKQRASSKRYNGPINNASTQIPTVADFFLFIPQAEMTDWQVVEGHQSSASWSPGAQVMVRPHPQVLLLLQAIAETSPLGCHVAISMEMRRQAGHGSDSHLYGQ